MSKLKPPSNKMRRVKDIFVKIGLWFKRQANIALVFSLIGGITGSINIYNWINEDPEYKFFAQALPTVDFRQVNGTPPKRLLMVVGAVYNDGQQPVFPVAFFLKMKIKDQKEIYVSMAETVPDSLVKMHVKGFQVRLETSSDLMRTVKVEPKGAAFGILFFLVPPAFTQLSDVESLYINCFDISNKEWTSKIDLENFADGSGDGRFNYPKSGTSAY